MSQFIISAFGDEIAPSLETQMKVLEQYGISHIEMRKVNGLALERYTLDEVSEIKEQLDARGFKISAIGSPIGKIKITDDFGPHMELFRHVIAIAEILEARFIRMFSFYIPVGENPVKYRDEVMRRWREFVLAAARTGLVLLHENEKEIYGDTPERCLDLLQTVDSDCVRAIFDPANFIQCSVRAYPDAFEVLKDYVVYLHIKDAVFSDRHVVPAGYGDGRIPEILTELDRSGFEGFLSLEPHLTHFEGFADLEPNSPRQDLPPGDGPEKFGVAAAALKKIIDQIEEGNRSVF